jgi:signal transduction histidine kinase
MVRTALSEHPWGALDVLVGHVATATGSRAAALWVRTHGEEDVPGVARLATWQRAGAPLPASAAADPVTLRAFQERSVALRDRNGPAVPPDDQPVAAFAVLLTADCPAVLTLYGTSDLTEGAFDVAVELLDVLPELGRAVRDRQARALADHCHDLVLGADPGSPDPAPAERLQAVLASVCDAVATALALSEVRLRLHATDGALGPAAEEVACAASRGGPGAGRTTDPSETPPATAPSPPSGVRVVSVPVLAGNDRFGLLECSRGVDRPFTPWDIAIVHTVAEQLARDWTVRARQVSVTAEIASWRALARSVTELNERLSDELEHRTHRDDQVYEAAHRVVGGVVSDLVGGHVWRVRPGTATGSRRVVHAHAVHGCGEGGGRPGPNPPAGGLAAQAYAGRRQEVVADRRRIARDGYGGEVGWVVSTPIGVGEETFGVLDAAGTSSDVAAITPQVCRIVADHLGLYLHLRDSLDSLRETRQDLEATIRTQAETLEDLEHQLVSPLINATNRIEGILRSGRLESRSTAQLRAVRGLCRKASRVAMSAGVFAALSKGKTPTPKLDFFSADDLVRVLVNAADDAQQLSDPRRGIGFTVDRESVRGLGRRLVRVDQSFLEQCVGNLLDNAAKYGYQDTCVRISGARRDDSFEVSVTSLGLRIRNDEARQCLQRSWRGVQARGATGEGSGLGLWIATQLMRSMRGDVQVWPDGDTTTVTLAVPLC